MTDSEQIAGALERLEPHDREVLYLSLRRRVPDEALAKLYDCPPGDVARLRAAATLIDDTSERPGDEGSSQRRFTPQKTGPLSAPFPSDPADANCYTTAF